MWKKIVAVLFIVSVFLFGSVAFVEIVYLLSYGLGVIAQGFKHLDGRLAIHGEDYFSL